MDSSLINKEKQKKWWKESPKAKLIRERFKKNNPTYHKEYNLNNKEKLLEQNKKNYIKNREKILKLDKEKYRNNRENKIEYQKKYYIENKERVLKYHKDLDNKKRFGGLREFVLERDNWQCVKCGMTSEQHIVIFGKSLTIDHIDGQGRNSKNPNNSPDNLQTLCLRCHATKDNLRYSKEKGIGRFKGEQL